MNAIARTIATTTVTMTSFTGPITSQASSRERRCGAASRSLWGGGLNRASGFAPGTRRVGTTGS
jgi:hypothetical protein